MGVLPSHASILSIVMDFNLKMIVSWKQAELLIPAPERAANHRGVAKNSSA